MEGYLITKDITWVTNNADGPSKQYAHKGTIYIPSLNLKLNPDNFGLTQIGFLELRNVKEFGLEQSNEPKLKRIILNDSKVQTLVSLLKEKEELPKKLENAVKSIVNPILP